MPSGQERARALNDARMHVWNQAKEVLDRAVVERRGLSAEEHATYDRLNADLDRYDRERDNLLGSDAYRSELGELNEAFSRAVGGPVAASARGNEAQTVREFLGGQRQSLTIDLRRASYVHRNYEAGARGPDMFGVDTRGIYGDAGGGSLIVPSLVSSTVYAVMQARNVMRQTRMSILTLPHGAPIAVPVGSQGVATQIANQNTSIGGTDPTMASKVLKAYDMGELVAVSNDIVQDSTVDVLQWVSDTIAAAVATKEEAWWAAGTGSTQPKGIMNAGGTGSAGTIATGGSLLLGPAGQELEKLIDVQYAVNSAYRQNGEWLVHDATAAKMRKIRDSGGGTIGQFVWSPSPTAGMLNGQPDLFLGRPIYTSAAVASMASNAKIMCYGDFSYFVGREVGGLQLQRSTDIYFDKNQTAIRGLVRIDSDLTDATAVVTLRQAVGDV
jgi:HK97 family phage major capsid protein